GGGPPRAAARGGAGAGGAGAPRYRASNVMLREDFAGMRDGMTAAHLAAKDVVRRHRPDLPVGLSVAMVDDVAAAGGEALRDRKREEVYGHWLRLAAQDDFVGVQNYERIVYGPDGPLPPADGAVVNEQGTAVEPASLRGAVEYAHAVSGVPVFVTEHGISTADDAVRAAFIPPAIEGLRAAMDAGTPVVGYCHWTLLDNFEWIFGYSRHLGLFAVDRETMARTAKPSAAVYADVVAGA
ncbi:MAG: family 1 glycosylhydrolase, partial [Microbacterium sp.]|uniref:family 1 glycosylhydrolase n=1 Tax=Microbacterium sp. TaxID=51671 RepID=UPI0039E4F3C5